MHEPVRSWKALAIGVASVLLVSLPASADDPLWEIDPVLPASQIDILILTTRPGLEGDFISQMVQSGPFYDHGGGFGQERIVESLGGAGLPGAGAAARMGARTGTTFFAISSYFTKEAADPIQKRRLEAVSDHLAAEPKRLQGQLVEFQVADWSWERSLGKTPAAAAAPERAQASLTSAERGRGASLLESRGTTLSFFKIGYTGQTAQLQLFDAEVGLDEIRKTIAGFPGIAGAAIYRLDDGRHAVYAEFFDTAGAMGAESAGNFGIVVENYSAF